MSKNTIDITVYSDNLGLGTGEDAVRDAGLVDGYLAEAERKIAARYPEYDVTVDLDCRNVGRYRVDVSSADMGWQAEEGMVEDIQYMLDEVWNHGGWSTPN